MIELVFVIVVLGILASLAMGRMDRDLRQEAAETILSHIRLAQQMALSDNKHRPSDGTSNDNRWQRAYWQFTLRPINGNWRYRVGSDSDLGGGANGLGKFEAAINPIDGKYLWTNTTNLLNDESPVILLTKKYGINNVSFTNACVNRQIVFDYLGRPHSNTSYNNPDFSNIMTSDCNLTFTLSTDQDNDGNPDSFVITIEKETGHAFIVGQEAL